MKKAIMLAVVATASTLLSAKTPLAVPPIIGTIKNSVGGDIVLATAQPKECAKSSRFFAYIRSATGKVTTVGCHSLNNDHILVFWLDGDVYEYPVSDIDFDPAWLEYMQKVSSQDSTEDATT